MTPGSVEPDRRPRPEYGEYATVEEQRARIRQPDVTAALNAGAAVAAETATPAVPQASAASRPPVAVRSARGRAGAVNRIVTIGLLVYGLISVVSSMVALGDFGSYSSEMLSRIGVDATLSNPDSARGWVLGGMLVLGLGWLLTAVVTWRVLRAGRISWWIPVVGGVVFGFLTGLLIAVPLVMDPGVMSALSNLGG